VSGIDASIYLSISQEGVLHCIFGRNAFSRDPLEHATDQIGCKFDLIGTVFVLTEENSQVQLRK
jgi:hypothetical protein